MKISKKTLNILILIFSAVFILAALTLAITLRAKSREQNSFDAIANEVGSIRGTAADAGSGDTPAKAEILPEYIQLHERNADVVGWLRIDGTVIDYPVVHTPDDPEYYLHRDLDGEESYSGTPFMDGACFDGSGHYIIHGHRMNDGTMFGALHEYLDEDYWREHPTIIFDSLYEHREFEVFAAFYGLVRSNYLPDGFHFNEYPDLTDEARFDEFLSNVLELRKYDTGIVPEYGDTLLTLSTCSKYAAYERMLVIAREIK